jgi:glycosyltransferase involved in cell wall biosynthesis
MSTTYNQPFNYIPNCVPLSISKNIIKTNTSTDNKCRFLFQGCLSKERNIDFLINLWDKVNENAVLIIRGPYWSYVDELKELLKNKNVLDNRILFLKEIPSDKLLEGIINDCDVGVLPYGPLNMNYKYCSPNKMGEFISMGKPILANKTEYVSQVITEADCGIVVDFTNENLLIDSINKLTTDIQFRKRYSENAFKYHETEFNWENKSQNFYNNIYEFVKDI